MSLPDRGGLGVPALICLAAIVLGCAGEESEGPPEVALGKATCAVCGMKVSDPLYAAVSRTPEGETFTFDDPGCLIRHLRERRDWVGDRIWLAAYDAEGRLVPLDGITLVGAEFPSPMGSGFAAFLDPATAHEEARNRGGVAGLLEDFVSGALQRPRGAR
jgi:hypothetical protein